MKSVAKVIYDDGYKIEMIRPVRDVAFQVGSTVEIDLAQRQVNLINTFNNLLDEETKNMILDKFNDSKKEVAKRK